MKRKRSVFSGLMIVAAISLLFSCGSNGNSSGSNESNEKSTVMTGNDRDPHGCIISAGYTWCQVQERCVRLWEDGVKMEYLEKADGEDTAQYNAYLLFSSDSVKVELFDVRLEKPLVLNRISSGSGIWSEGDFSVKKVNGKWAVQKGDEIVTVETGD